MRLRYCFPTTHLTYFLYRFPALTAPKMFCKISSTFSTAFIRHQLITFYEEGFCAFNRVQIVLVVHHRIHFEMIVNIAQCMNYDVIYTHVILEKNKKKRKDILYGYAQSCWPLNFISEIPFLSNSCTALGSGTYNSFVAYFWPSVTNQ